MPMRLQILAVPLNAHLYGRMVLYRQLSGALSAVRRGFTLVELLAVIAVISILLALLLPVVNRSMSSAKSVQCLSSEKQLQTAYQLYLNDNSQKLIPYLLTSKTFWYALTSPYRDKDDRLNLCPNATKPTAFPATCAWSFGGYGSYGFNGFFYSITEYQGTLVGGRGAGRTDVDTQKYWFKNMANADPLSPLFFDSQWIDMWMFSEQWNDALTKNIKVDGINPAPAQSRCWITRHDDKINVVCASGHARAIPMSELKYQKWNLAGGVNPP